MNVSSSWLVIDGKVFRECHCPVCVADKVGLDCEPAPDPDALCAAHYSDWYEQQAYNYDPERY